MQYLDRGVSMLMSKVSDNSCFFAQKKKIKLDSRAKYSGEDGFEGLCFAAVACRSCS